MRFVMMDIDAVPIRIGRINVKSWNDFQSSHWFAAIARLPFAPILAIFGIVMRLHVAHTRGQPVAWKNAKMPLNYVRLNADCTLSLSLGELTGSLEKRFDVLLTSVLFTFDDIARIKTKMRPRLRMENTNERLEAYDCWQTEINCEKWKLINNFEQIVFDSRWM